jgi:hypothetical protein
VKLKEMQFKCDAKSSLKSFYSNKSITERSFDTKNMKPVIKTLPTNRYSTENSLKFSNVFEENLQNGQQNKEKITFRTNTNKKYIK